MSTATPFRIPLRATVRTSIGPRRREPATVGVPLPRGLVTTIDALGLEGADGRPLPLQAAILDRWSDGSARWLLIDTQVDVVDGTTTPLVLHAPAAVSTAGAGAGLSVEASAGSVRVETGAARFDFRAGARFPFAGVHVGGHPAIDAPHSGLMLEIDGRATDLAIADVQVRRSGPVRAELELTAKPAGNVALPVEVRASVELFAGQASARFAIVLRNPRRAQHAGGQWGLGDPGSISIRSAVLRLTTPARIERVDYTLEPDASASSAPPPFELHQESSGGPHWDAPVHVDARGRVPLRFRGFRLRADGGETTGLRATPTIAAVTRAGALTIAPLQFWERFPAAVAVDVNGIELGILPGQSAVAHELQGGEQMTRRVVVAFGSDPIAPAPLAWAHAPVLISAEPEFACDTGAVPCLVASSADSSPAYLALASLALDPDRGMLAKREAADEFGWRNFGDVPADHESAFRPPESSFVSHYNNQYDALAGFIVHFLRTGDPAWWQLADDLARHVRDVDIYHTDQDKAAYNGGLFWHTNHYADAGTSTHRTYAPGSAGSGGPSAEHNYNAGLMLHYFLTGETASRDAAVGLGRWVLTMDDGGLTVFRWLARGATGLANATGGHFGAGRGAGHSILACLVAFQLTADRRYVEKAEELMRRCVHPGRAIDPAYFDDIEGYWSYTAFLQALGLYMWTKVERGETDEMYTYARESLLQFARWMCDRERPYLDRRELLAYPTETWAAQDLRKAEVFAWAALCATGAEREVFLERARFFFEYAVGTLPTMHGHWFARPIVLVLTQGVRYAWLTARAGEGMVLPEGAPLDRWREPQTFEPQKARAMRRARWLAAGGAAGLVAVVLVALWALLR